MPIEVSAIRVYPVKSLQPMCPDSVKVERRGLQNDRRWMVIDENGAFRTRREVPSMAPIKAITEHGHLHLSRDGDRGVRAPLKPEGQSIKVQIWKSQTMARLVSKEADEWLTNVIGLPSRLVYMTESSRRRISPDFNTGKDYLGFADAFPILVASEASIADLNSRMQESIPIQRFRMNIVVKGCGAFEEDSWASIKIGDVVLRAARPCIRCLVTTQDPLTGDLLGPEPLKTLASYRRVQNGVIFGMYYIPEKLGGIHVGDSLIANR